MNVFAAAREHLITHRRRWRTAAQLLLGIGVAILAGSFVAMLLLPATVANDLFVVIYLLVTVGAGFVVSAVLIYLATAADNFWREHSDN